MFVEASGQTKTGYATGRRMVPMGRLVRNPNRRPTPRRPLGKGQAYPHVSRGGRRALGMSLSAAAFCIGMLCTIIGPLQGFSNTFERFIARPANDLQLRVSSVDVTSPSSAPEKIYARRAHAVNEPIVLHGGSRMHSITSQRHGASSLSRIIPSFTSPQSEHDVAKRDHVLSGQGNTKIEVRSVAHEPRPDIHTLIKKIIQRYSPKHKSPDTLAQTIIQESKALGFDPLFVTAVIKSESTFNPLARSPKGAQGLMQIMPKTGAWLARQNKLGSARLSNPQHNIQLGIRYLKHLDQEYAGNKVFTLVAYNWGPGHLESATGGKRRIPRECMTYALKILKDYRRWKTGSV